MYNSICIHENDIDVFLSLLQGMQIMKVNIANRSSFAATSTNLSETRVSVWKAA